jgi:lactoylglutathione lyase
MYRFGYGSLLVATVSVVALYSLAGYLGCDKMVQADEKLQKNEGINTMKLGYTSFYVRDVEKTLAFYESAFGLSRKFYNKNGAHEYGELDTGATTLDFVSYSLAQATLKSAGRTTFSEAQSTGPAPPVDIGFVTDDVAAAYAKAVKAGAVEVAPPEDKPWGQTVAYVRDLNGFLVALCTEVKQ